MNIHSFTVAVAGLCFATAALATEAAADATIVSLGKTYSEQDLAAICGWTGGLSYRAGEGRYGCTNGTNNVECRNDGACTGFMRAPFAFIGAGAGRDIDAETVLWMPATRELTGSTASGVIVGPE